MREMKLSLAGWMLLTLAMLVSGGVSYAIFRSDYGVARFRYLAGTRGLEEFGGDYGVAALVILCLLAAGSACVIAGRTSDRVSTRRG